jgi:hypothetical protein
MVMYPCDGVLPSNEKEGTAALIDMMVSKYCLF